jgi:hypothetical protein
MDRFLGRGEQRFFVRDREVVPVKMMLPVTAGLQVSLESSKNLIWLSEPQLGSGKMIALNLEKSSVVKAAHSAPVTVFTE